jgi:hypothetical protein
MKLEIELSDKLLKKIRALGILCGDKAADFESLVLGHLENYVDDAIMEAIGKRADAVYSAGYAESPRPVKKKKNKQAPAYNTEDVSGIADGLGDETDEYIDEGAMSEEEAMAPEGGLTEELIEKDMRVEDPDSEAKAEPPTFADTIGKSGEEMFSELTGLPPVPEVAEIDPRVARRKKRLTGTKGKAVAFMGAESASF